MTTTHSNQDPVQALLARWFVQYNPFFTMSALCVLAGVLVVSRALGNEADVALMLILEAYQWMLIGAAAVLYRRILRRRSAAILGIIQLAFLIDPTLRVPDVAAGGHALVVGLWVLSFHLKLRALGGAFQLRVAPGVLRAITACVLVVAGLPVMRVEGVSVAWTQAVLAVTAFLGVRAFAKMDLSVTSTKALTGFALVAFPRIVRAAWYLLIAGAAYHLWNAMLAVGLATLAPAVGAVFLACAMFADSLSETVIPVVIGLVVSLAGDVQGLTVGLAITGAMYLLLSRRMAPRVAMCGILALYEAARLASDVETFRIAAAIALAVGALGFLVFRRGYSAIPTMIVLCAPWASTIVKHTPGATPLQMGAGLVVMGFVLLGAGFVIHGFIAEPAPPDDESAQPPSTSAAIASG